MKTKETEAVPTLTEEADHSSNKESKKVLQEGTPRNLTGNSTGARTSKPVSDNAEIDTLEGEITKYWEEPTFQKLKDNTEFNQTLDSVCQREFSRFQQFPAQSWEDIKLVVLARYVKWLPQSRGEASHKTVLTRVVRNLLIDMGRQNKVKPFSFEELERAIEDGKRKRPESFIHRVSNINSNIQVQEWLGKLPTLKEKQLFIGYFVEDKTVKEIALEYGITRQAVSKRIDKIAAKLKPYVC